MFVLLHLNLMELMEIVYLTDFPNSDQTTGIVKFFKIVDGAITYINNDAGIIITQKVK